MYTYLILIKLFNSLYFKGINYDKTIIIISVFKVTYWPYTYLCPRDKT